VNSLPEALCGELPAGGRFSMSMLARQGDAHVGSACERGHSFEESAAAVRKDVSFLQKEIHQQPEVLAALVQQEEGNVRRIGADLRQHGVRYILIAARGSSDNAARYGQYLLGAHNQLLVGLATPSLFTIYGEPPRLEGCLVVGISQSGQSPDIVAVLAEGRRQGAPTLAITNDPNSPLAARAEYVIPLHAGEERALAATKTYTAELAALALLSCSLDPDRGHLEALGKIPLAVEHVLANEGLVAEKVGRYRYMDTCVVVGRGYNYATAFEIALKLKELNYLIAESYSSADFMHGPIAMVGSGFPAIVVAPSGKMFDTMRAFGLELKARGAELLVIADRQDMLAEAVTTLALPEHVPEWLSPIVAVVAGQLFTLHLTLAKRNDPDRANGLMKVTRTR
jgi:glucosamine--fructose-6-phosphate aminotransferase (isomerizing)